MYQFHILNPRNNGQQC